MELEGKNQGKKTIFKKLHLKKSQNIKIIDLKNVLP